MIKFNGFLTVVLKKITLMNTDKLEAVGRKITRRLSDIRISVGARAGNFATKTIQLDEDELRKRANLNPGKPIIIDGELHLAYIKDHDNHFSGLEECREQVSKFGCYKDGRKIHFYYCRTLQRMYRDGRQQRYHLPVFRSRWQPIDLPEVKDRSTPLAWCQNCIKSLQNMDIPLIEAAKEVVGSDDPWFNDAPPKLAVNGDHKTLSKLFRPNSILMKNFVSDLPSSEDPSGYHPNKWRNISKSVRKEHGYKCKSCGVDCSGSPNLLDVHHINGRKSDCDDSNLRCLCKYCHSQQPMHGHYKPSPNELQSLRQLWREQGIQDPTQRH